MSLLKDEETGRRYVKSIKSSPMEIKVLEAVTIANMGGKWANPMMITKAGKKAGSILDASWKRQAPKWKHILEVLTDIGILATKNKADKVHGYRPDMSKLEKYINDPEYRLKKNIQGKLLGDAASERLEKMHTRKTERKNREKDGEKEKAKKKREAEKEKEKKKKQTEKEKEKAKKEKEKAKAKKEAEKEKEKKEKEKAKKDEETDKNTRKQKKDQQDTMAETKKEKTKKVDTKKTKVDDMNDISKVNRKGVTKK